MPTAPARTQLDTRISPGARRAVVVRVMGAGLACVLALLAVINPMLALGVTIGLLLAAAFTQSVTFGVCAFVAVGFFEMLTNVAGTTALSPVKVLGGAL